MVGGRGQQYLEGLDEEGVVKGGRDLSVVGAELLEPRLQTRQRVGHGHGVVQLAHAPM